MSFNEGCISRTSPIGKSCLSKFHLPGTGMRLLKAAQRCDEIKVRSTLSLSCYTVALN